MKPTLKELTHLNFFKFLFTGEEEWKDEQAYYTGRMSIHNAYLHGAGIVHGLEIEVDNISTPAKVLISPGLAFDAMGHELIIPEELDVSGDIKKSEIVIEPALPGIDLLDKIVYVTLEWNSQLFQNQLVGELDSPREVPTRVKEYTRTGLVLKENYNATSTTIILAAIQFDSASQVVSITPGAAADTFEASVAFIAVMEELAAYPAQFYEALIHNFLMPLKEEDLDYLASYWASPVEPVKPSENFPWPAEVGKAALFGQALWAHYLFNSINQKAKLAATLTKSQNLKESGAWQILNELNTMQRDIYNHVEQFNNWIENWLTGTVWDNIIESLLTTFDPLISDMETVLAGDMDIEAAINCQKSINNAINNYLEKIPAA